MNIGFIGAGKMGTALAEGIAGKNPHIIFFVYDKLEEQCSKFSDKVNHSRLCRTSSEVLENSEIVFIAVKPKNFPEISSSLFPFDKVIVSIMAGIAISSIKSAAPSSRIIRVMPNTPCIAGQMAAGFSADPDITADEKKTVKSLLDSSGISIEVNEDKLDAVTALSGSGPAFFALLFRYFITAGEKMGLDHDTSLRLCLQTARGTISLLDNFNMAADELADMVTSKGGTTEAGRNVLENSDISLVIENTLKAAEKRSRELR